MIMVERVKRRIRNFDPLIYADKNWNIWLFESFGLGIEISSWSICLVLGFLTINCYLVSNYIVNKEMKRWRKKICLTNQN